MPAPSNKSVGGPAVLSWPSRAEFPSLVPQPSVICSRGASCSPSGVSATREDVPQAALRLPTGDPPGGSWLRGPPRVAHRGLHAPPVLCGSGPAAPAAFAAPDGPATGTRGSRPPGDPDQGLPTAQRPGARSGAPLSDRGLRVVTGVPPFAPKLARCRTCTPGEPLTPRPAARARARGAGRASFTPTAHGPASGGAGRAARVLGCTLCIHAHRAQSSVRCGFGGALRACRGARVCRRSLGSVLAAGRAPCSPHRPAAPPRRGGSGKLAP